MTAERALIAALIASLADAMTRRWHGERHQENCGRGIWRGQWAHGDGAACSSKCQAAQDALAAGRAYLAATALVQGRLEMAS